MYLGFLQADNHHIIITTRAGRLSGMFFANIYCARIWRLPDILGMVIMFCSTSRKRCFSLFHPTRGRLRPRELFGGPRKTSSSGLAGHRLSCAQRSALRAAAFSAASARSPLAVAFRPRFARNAASENGRRHQRFKVHVTQHDVELFSVRKKYQLCKIKNAPALFR